MAFVEEESPGAPEWIVTFSDMISLLVTFFVLLLSFASVATKEEAKMKQFLRGMWGLFPSEDGAATETPKEELSPDRTYRINASLDKNSRPFEDVLHELERAGMRKDDERLPIDLAASTSGLRLTFSEAEYFQPGDDHVSPTLESALVRLADVVRHYGYEIVVEGSAGAVADSSSRFTDPALLSLARAAAAADVLTGSGKLEPESIALSRISTNRTSSPESARERCVELRLVPILRD